MDTSISREIRADPLVIFELAADVQNWPRILPHYRWVHVVRTEGDNQTAVETTLPADRRIEFEHVGGITRGMHVAWTIEPTTEQSIVLVRIRHVFDPHWPVPHFLVRLIVGEFFVNGVARRTLRCIADLAEASSNLQALSEDA